MKRKALLLIIPFAAAGLAGCQQANPPTPPPQCDSATISITSAGGVTAIKPGEQLQLSAEVNLHDCSFSWDSTNKSVATVDSNGLVTAISVGETTIKYGSGEFELSVEENPPAPQKEVVEVLSVKSHPESVTVGGSISPSSVILNVKLSDGTETTKAATKIDCDTSKAADSVEATAWYNQIGSAKFNIKVVAQGQTTHAGTEADPYDSADAASVASALAEGGVTQQSYYIKGTVEKFEETFSSQYGNYSFNIGNNFICWRLKNGSSKANFNEGDIEIGDEVVVYAQIQKFHQDAQGDKPARNLLETKDGYVVSVNKGGEQKEVNGITAVSYTKTLYVGGTINPSDVTLTVSYSDGTSGSVKAQRVDGYSTATAGNTTATAHYGTFEKNFVVEVKIKPAPTGESSIYTFTNDKTNSQNMAGWTSEQFLTHVVVDGDEVITGIKDVTNAYIGGNGGSEDTAWNIWNCFKVGKSNAGGTATLTLDSSIVFESIKVSAIGNRDDGTLTINGVTKNVTKKAEKDSLEPMELEFEVAGGISELTFSSKEASSGNYGICITKIEFVGGGTPTPQKEITGVELQGTLAKSSYVAGQTFDPSGLSLKVTYNEGDPDVLTSGFSFNVTNPLEVGEYDLKATYQGHTTEGSVHISVVALAITALEIKSGMTKTAYVLEEAWAPAGIVVEATYNDGTKANLQSGDYTLEFDPTEPALDIEEVSIVAKVANGTTSAAYTQTVSVTEEKVEATLTGIVASGYTNTATVGQTYTFDGTVTASYSDGSSHAVTGYTWTTSISTASAGQKTGVISYTEGDETKTCNVVVTVSAPATEKTFDLVKKQDELTSGKYLITHGTTGSVHVFNSSLETLDAVNNYVSATVSNGSITMTTDLEAVMVEYNADDGSLKLPSGKYLDGSTAKSLKTNSSAVEHTITIGNDGATTINCGSNALKFNDANDQMRFRYYASGQKALNLFKLAEGEPAPAKDIESLGDVSAPESINKGAKLDTKDVDVAVVYTDKTEGSVHPDSIDLDTSTVSNSVTGTVHVGNLTATFTIKVVEAPAPSQQKDLTFSFATNPGEWPGSATTSATTKTIKLNDVDYTFSLGVGIYWNSSGYLMLNKPTALGLPAIQGYKLTKVVATNSSGCSTSVKVGISSSSSTESYISGGETQTWSNTSTAYTYELSETAANTMYYMYVTNKNAQIVALELIYSPAN